jgi:hypothetical protein
MVPAVAVRRQIERVTGKDDREMNVYAGRARKLSHSVSGSNLDSPTRQSRSFPLQKNSDFFLLGVHVGMKDRGFEILLLLWGSPPFGTQAAELLWAQHRRSGSSAETLQDGWRRRASAT